MYVLRSLIKMSLLRVEIQERCAPNLNKEYISQPIVGYSKPQHRLNNHRDDSQSKNIKHEFLFSNDVFDGGEDMDYPLDYQPATNLMDRRLKAAKDFHRMPTKSTLEHLATQACQIPYDAITTIPNMNQLCWRTTQDEQQERLTDKLSISHLREILCRDGTYYTKKYFTKSYLFHRVCRRGVREQ